MMWALAAAAIWLHVALGPPSGHIGIRWIAGLSPADRTRVERQLALATGDPGEFWDYTLQDRSRHNIAAILSNASVVETRHLDRTRLRVQLDRPDWPTWLVSVVESDRLPALAFALALAGLVVIASARREVSAVAARTVARTRRIQPADAALAAIIVTFFIELIRTAWISDDAAITLRTVLNFLNGYGPRFNIDERVQAYTHPLWFLLLSAVSLVTANVFLTVFVVAIGLSLAGFWICIRRLAISPWHGVLAGFILVCSKAFVDYSTSGLENPLSRILILSTLLVAIRDVHKTSARALSAFFLLYFLTYLSRPDLPLLLFPLAATVAYHHRAQPRALMNSVAVGLLPVLAWTLFSLYYYGFPFPNTAYAKLGTGVPLDYAIDHGSKYLLDSIFRDPVTLAGVVAGTVIGVLSSQPYARAIVLGVWLYIAYVVSVGGDFMSGRFLTAPLLVSVVLIARSKMSRMHAGALAAVTGCLALVSIEATLFSGADYTNRVVNNGIADERGWYFRDFGLVASDEGTFDAPAWNAGTRAVRVVDCGGLGWEGIHSGPGTHAIDRCALADPLLSRLPTSHDPDWRIGHFIRPLPDGYVESVKSGSNLLRDPEIREYYDSIRRITRGDLNDFDRLREILLMNLGQIDAPEAGD